MIIKKRPSQIVNFSKFMIIAILVIFTSVIYYVKDIVGENEYVQDFFRNFYDADIINSSQFDYLMDNGGLILCGVFATITFIFVLRLLYFIIFIKTTEYIFDFDTKTITLEEGIFSKYKDGIAFSAIVDIDITQSMIEMITKKHTIKIYTKGDMTKQSKKGLTREEIKNISEINSNIEFGYVSLKKFKSITEGELIFNKLTAIIQPPTI